MHVLSLLRKLVDYQQFDELRASAEEYWVESSDIQVLPLLAMAFLQLDNRVSTEKYLLEIDANKGAFDLDARVDFALVLILLWRVAEAVALLDDALEDDPAHALALARRAWCWMQQGELDKARHLYERSATLVPGRIPVYTSLVSLFLEQDDVDAAQATLDSGVLRLEEIYTELPETVVLLYTAQLRELQLAIWAAKEDFARCDDWLDQKQPLFSEDEWVALVIHYAMLLGQLYRHDQAVELFHEAIKKYPGNIELHTQMIELAQLQGHKVQAMHLSRKVIALASKQGKPEAHLWAKLSDTCLHLSDNSARSAAKKAVELAEAMKESDNCSAAVLVNSRAQAKLAMAQVESDAQNYDLAESLFRQLLESDPNFVPALQGLGQQQLERGNIDEAVRLFERLKMLVPAKGYSALINARQFPEDEATLHQIERVARKPSMAGAVSSGLLFQLAAAWEKRMDYDKAFALVSDANQASRHLLSYDGKAHRNRCARIRAGFCPELYGHRKGHGVESSLPVYVLGMPRSGTTLVEQILAGHSDIFGAGELSIMSQVVQGFERWERRVGSGRHYPECVDDMSPVVTRDIAENALKELQAYQPDARHIIDKLPHNFEHIGLIKFLFPNAKIISVRRDPRDIAISNYFTDYQAKFGGMGFAYNLTDIGEQLADHNMMMHHWHQLFPGEILEINYEDVVDDVEAAARKMLDYIGVEWQPQVLAFNKLDRPVKTASVWQVRQPIYKTSKARWEHYQAHLGPLIKGTNAKIEPDPITDMERLPEAGLFVDGVALYEEGKLDEAEYNFKKILHHIPEHGAANFMLGIIYACKGHLADGIASMEKGFDKCPWNSNWRNDLIQAYEQVGDEDKAEALRKRFETRRSDDKSSSVVDIMDEDGNIAAESSI